MSTTTSFPPPDQSFRRTSVKLEELSPTLDRFAELQRVRDQAELERDVALQQLEMMRKRAETAERETLALERELRGVLALQQRQVPSQPQPRPQNDGSSGAESDGQKAIQDDTELEELRALVDIYKAERNSAYQQLHLLARQHAIEIQALQSKLDTQSETLQKSFEHWRRWATDVDEMHRSMVERISAYAAYWRPYIAGENVVQTSRDAPSSNAGGLPSYPRPRPEFQPGGSRVRSGKSSPDGK
ncbi:hypothetical protein C8F01DRAFT_1174009 [Mycena amicta]|nr:hypothetical protein C8F01DRAFT_1174009 [Mycena amicta]